MVKMIKQENVAKQEIVDLIKEHEVISEGHFVIVSGRHSNKFLDTTKLMCNTNTHPKIVVGLKEIIERETEIDGIVYPYTTEAGGQIISYLLAKELKNKRFSEGSRHDIFQGRICGDGSYVRGTLPRNKVILVDGVTINGKLLTHAYYVINDNKDEVIGAYTIANLGHDKMELPVDQEFSGERVKVKSLLYRTDFNNFEIWTTDKCPLCKEGEKLIFPPNF